MLSSPPQWADSKPLVAVIVLNWNNAADTLQCLASLEQSDYPRQHVIVIDNGSTDGSVATISGQFPAIELIALPQNMGYAEGNNIGVRHALAQGADYVWLVNDDTVVAPDALSALVARAVAEPRAGMLGPKVLTREEPQCLLSAGGRLEAGFNPVHYGIGEFDGGQFDTVADVGFVSGCALLVGRALIEQVGLLDPQFFAYYEDVDWCLRARQAGYRVMYVAGARVWHPDTRRRDADSPRVTYYMTRNRLTLARKHGAGASVMGRLARQYIRTWLSWTLRPRWRHKARQRDALRAALWDFTRGYVGAARL